MRPNLQMSLLNDIQTETFEELSSFTFQNLSVLGCATLWESLRNK